MSVNLAGMWRSVHTDPTNPRDPETRGEMTLRQDGDQVKGEDRVDGVVYLLSGRVKRDAFLGTWEDEDGTYGSGEFTLTIKENGETLEGHYTWYPRNDCFPYRAQRRSG